MKIILISYPNLKFLFFADIQEKFLQNVVEKKEEKEKNINIILFYSFSKK